MGEAALLEVEHLLEVDTITDVAIGKAAFMDNAAGALDVGPWAAGKKSGHTKGHRKCRADSEGQRAAHEEAGAGDVGGFRGKFGLG